MDRLHPELVLGELDHEAHDGAVSRCRRAGVAALVAVVDRGLEPVVPVGEHDRCTPDDRDDRVHVGRLGDAAELVRHAVVVHGLGEGERAVGHRGQSRGRREPPDRVEVDPRRPEQREAVALRLGQRALVGEDVALARRGRQDQPAEDADRVPGRGALVGVAHAVAVEGGLVVAGEDAGSRPLGEQVCRVLVAVGVAVGLGEDQPDRVVLGPLRESVALVGIDDVIGWRDHRFEVDGVVADAAERAELGHAEEPPGRSGDCGTGRRRAGHRAKGIGEHGEAERGDRLRSRRRALDGRPPDPRCGRGGRAGCGRRAGGSRFLTNNSSRVIDDVRDQLGLMGVATGRADVLSSAQAAASRAGRGPCGRGPGARVGRAGHRGGARRRRASRRSRTTRPSRGDVAAVVCGMDRAFDFARLDRAAAAVRAGARFVATNTDPTFPAADRITPGAGALVAAIATASGAEPEVAGKPAAPTVALVRARLGVDGRHRGRPAVDRRRARRAGSGGRSRWCCRASAVTTRTSRCPNPPPAWVAADLAALVEPLARYPGP